MSDDQNTPNAVELATELTIAWLGNHSTRAGADDIPTFLSKMHETVTALIGGGSPATEASVATEYTPAVLVRKSLPSKDHIISMLDGKPYKTLRRHLATNGLTPEEYRSRYGLKKDYPMVSENYSASRREMAHKIGFGRKAGQKAQAADKPAKTARPKKAKTVAADA